MNEGQCALCDIKTTKVCSKCRLVYFRCAQHQAWASSSSFLLLPIRGVAEIRHLSQLWPTHKYLCGRDPGFLWQPELGKEEEALFQRVTNRKCRSEPS